MLQRIIGSDADRGRGWHGRAALAAAACAVACTAAMAAAGPALAASPICEGPAVRYKDLNGSSSTVTLGCSDAEPGAEVPVSGTGFLGTNGSGGVDVVAKGDDDASTWTWPTTGGYGGPDAVTPSVAGSRPTFASESNGTFSGWVIVPSNLSTNGPGTGAHADQHWLRFLAGTFGNKGPAKTFQAFFTVAEGATVTLTPSTVAPGASVSVTGYLFPPSAPVAVTLDGTAVSGASLTADASGDVSGNVTIPAGTVTGSHKLTFTSGTASASATVSVSTSGGSGGGGGGGGGPGGGGGSGGGGGGGGGSGGGGGGGGSTSKQTAYATIASGVKTLSMRSGRIAVKLTGHGATGKVRVTIATAGKVRVTPRVGKRKVVTVTRSGSVTLKAAQTRTAKLALTAAGKKLLASVRQVRVRVRIAGGKTVTRTLTLHVAAKAKKAKKRAARR